MRNQTKLHLQQLQLAMQKLDLWQVTPPAQEAFFKPRAFFDWYHVARRVVAMDFHPKNVRLTWKRGWFAITNCSVALLEEAFKEAEEDF